MREYVVELYQDTDCFTCATPVGDYKVAAGQIIVLSYQTTEATGINIDYKLDDACGEGFAKWTKDGSGRNSLKIRYGATGFGIPRNDVFFWSSNETDPMYQQVAATSDQGQTLAKTVTVNGEAVWQPSKCRFGTPGMSNDASSPCVPPKAPPDVNECALNTAGCHQYATCTNNINAPATCTCTAGYQGNGFNCTDIDECVVGIDFSTDSGTFCSRYASCLNSVGSATCVCLPGFEGDGKTCLDIDECAAALRVDQLCPRSSTCVNNVGSYSCECRPGYAGPICQDVDECADGTLRCVADATCTNTLGSATCECNAGFVGDGFEACADVNECEYGVCPESSVCTNTAGSYTCACLPGYTGFGCWKVEECSEHASYFNVFGRQVCICDSGFEGYGKVCTDIDECAIAGAVQCGPNASCTNNVASAPTCTCNPGFAGDGQVCVDLNECVDGTVSRSPHATCTNTVGSFTCTCRPGFEGNGQSCTDIDECNNGIFSCPLGEPCTNTVGSFSCSCRPGFGGYWCDDIDECADGTAGCSELATCTNTHGSAVCTCQPGYQGNGQRCDDFDECAAGAPETFCHEHATCTNTVGSATCVCNEGYRGDGVIFQDNDSPTLAPVVPIAPTPVPPILRRFLDTDLIEIARNATFIRSTLERLADTFAANPTDAGRHALQQETLAALATATSQQINALIQKMAVLFNWNVQGEVITAGKTKRRQMCDLFNEYANSRVSQKTKDCMCGSTEPYLRCDMWLGNEAWTFHENRRRLRRLGVTNFDDEPQQPRRQRQQKESPKSQQRKQSFVQEQSQTETPAESALPPRVLRRVSAADFHDTKSWDDNSDSDGLNAGMTQATSSNMTGSSLVRHRRTAGLPITCKLRMNFDQVVSAMQSGGLPAGGGSATCCFDLYPAPLTIFKLCGAIAVNVPNVPWLSVAGAQQAIADGSIQKGGDQIKALANGLNLEIKLALCWKLTELLKISSQMSDILSFFGLDSCLLAFRILMYPASAAARVEVELQLGILFVKAALMWQMDTKIRDILGLCDSVSPECGDTSSAYCALGPGEVMGMVTIGIDFFLFDVGLDIPIGNAFYRNCQKFPDGKLCLWGTTCNNCRNPATYWYGKAYTACGTEPRYPDGTTCLLGTSCNSCENGATWWDGAFFSKCGREPPWVDGAVCALGTTCHNCANPAKWWSSKLITACGYEPELPDGTLCAICTSCRNEATFWYGPNFQACGIEPRYPDGTTCVPGLSCNACQNQHTYWWGPLLVKCGSEPKWPDGTMCATGSSCWSCLNKETYWYGPAKTACGNEPKYPDGTTCLAGTSCNVCQNQYTFWVGPFITKCGREPCWPQGTKCVLWATCRQCCWERGWWWSCG